MTITASVIADSISPLGKRITTLQLRYPRFIHAEFMTHRMFSRNASSSRAIPVRKMIQEVLDDPAMPVFWGKNQTGMQAAEELDNYGRNWAEHDWLQARDAAVKHVHRLVEIGLHKQIANRVLEPWTHINVVVTATEWSNFFALRCHPAAQPEIRVLAEMMQNALTGNDPLPLHYGEWHLPYLASEDWEDVERWHKENPEAPKLGLLDKLRKMSVARCARVSYMTHEMKKPSVEEDLALYERLVGAHPMHASPAEHQATPDEPLDTGSVPCPHDQWTRWMTPHLQGNFVGWRQYRKMLVGECQ